MGTIGIYVSEGGMSAELHGVGALGAGFDYISPSTFQTGYDVDGYANIQYHLPADLLPFGIGAKVGFVPNMSATTLLSAKESDATITDQSEGRSLEMIQVSAAPIDGLTVTGSFVETSAIGAATGSEDGIAAAVNAKYTIGQVSLGYAENGYQPATGAAVDDPTIYYDNKFYGISFAVNDARSVIQHG